MSEFFRVIATEKSGVRDSMAFDDGRDAARDYFAKIARGGYRAVELIRVRPDGTQECGSSFKTLREWKARVDGVQAETPEQFASELAEEPQHDEFSPIFDGPVNIAPAGSPVPMVGNFDLPFVQVGDQPYVYERSIPLPAAPFSLDRVTGVLHLNNVIVEGSISSDPDEEQVAQNLLQQDLTKARMELAEVRAEKADLARQNNALHEHLGELQRSEDALRRMLNGIPALGQYQGIHAQVRATLDQANKADQAERLVHAKNYRIDALEKQVERLSEKATAAERSAETMAAAGDFIRTECDTKLAKAEEHIEALNAELGRTQRLYESQVHYTDSVLRDNLRLVNENRSLRAGGGIIDAMFAPAIRYLSALRYAS